MLGLAACAKPLIILILTEKWLPSVPYVILFCFSYALLPVQTANLNAIKAMGYSGIYLKLEIVRKAAGLLIVFITMWKGPMAMAAGNLIIGLVNQKINGWPNRSLLNYSYREQFMDMMPSAAMAGSMFLAICQLQKVIVNPLVLLSIQIPAGICIYIIESVLIRDESYYYLLSMLKGLAVFRRGH